MFFKKNKTTNLLKAGMIGHAVGDAMGVPFEFKTRDTFNAKEMTEGGIHNQPIGTWSDDTALTLCLLSVMYADYSQKNFYEAVCSWYYDGKYSADDKIPFSVGDSTARGIVKIKENLPNPDASLETNNGNGALMRILPLIFWTEDCDAEGTYTYLKEIVHFSHAHKRSDIACMFYLFMGKALVSGETIDSSYNLAKTQTIDFFGESEPEFIHYERLLKGDIKLLSKDEIKNTGYVVDTIEAAIWSILNTSSYKEAVLTAVNLGGDTDTIGAITGGLAGIYYGYQEIPKKWRKNLIREKQISQFCDLFQEKYETK